LTHSVYAVYSLGMQDSVVVPPPRTELEA